MARAKFDKHKCLRCKYAVNMSGGYCVRGKDEKPISLLCDYSGNNKDGKTCLYIGEDRKVHDRRGEDYHNCKLFTPDKENKRRSL